MATDQLDPVVKSHFLGVNCKGVEVGEELHCCVKENLKERGSFSPVSDGAYI